LIRFCAFEISESWFRLDFLPVGITYAFKVCGGFPSDLFVFLLKYVEIAEDLALLFLLPGRLTS
jgi:hypothetical protein